jgi:riboflavin kinase / FMN adenylyltransferase
LPDTEIRDAPRAGRSFASPPGSMILQPPVIIDALVERGRQIGRTLGFPTANFSLEAAPDVRHGVYASRSRLADGRWFFGVASVGENPTVGIVEPRLEVWLFDFDEDIYGQRVQTVLDVFLRPETKFGSWEQLTAQVMIDADDARRIQADRSGVDVAPVGLRVGR